MLTYPMSTGRNFDEVMDQVKRWSLDQFLKERSFDSLVYRAAP